MNSAYIKKMRDYDSLLNKEDVGDLYISYKDLKELLGEATYTEKEFCEDSYIMRGWVFQEILQENKSIKKGGGAIELFTLNHEKKCKDIEFVRIRANSMKAWNDFKKLAKLEKYKLVRYINPNPSIQKVRVQKGF